ncbi:hypothetical protein FHS18_004234 [Paenibacillus phyllosphaerae]|uniref:Type II secretion system protein GspF domain-containing protein n=1 Tax=Paenibacillus phyllosphaerae TaxID=274593 RepID=A0A7W5B1I1_9BACL|nr:type II secretion system F family protein [Paenibacillus phyllosphaerae]MBB3112156.1 hypothetical protein [Paenibacillus phyllosphaerae]
MSGFAFQPMWLLLGALFVTLFILQLLLLRIWSTRQIRQSRLSYRQDNRLRSRLTRWLQRFERPYRHLAELIEAVELPIAPDTVLAATGLLFLTGTTLGVILFHNLKGTLMLGAMLTGLPYVVLWMLLMRRRMQTRIDFLPAVELFYQCCLMNGGRQIRTALQRTVDEKRLLGLMQSVFEQLYRNLSVRGDDEASLRIFAASSGHIWADYFVNILRAGLAEGYPITDSLKELIHDMRRARRANQQERNKLLEIRIANFTPILFLGLFLFINFRYNRASSYLYYVVDPQGRELILNAVALIFVSFLMGLWLSRKKM